MVPLLLQASTASTNNALRALCESVRQHCEADNLEDTVGLAQSVSATVFQVYMSVCVSYNTTAYVPSKAACFLLYTMWPCKIYPLHVLLTQLSPFTWCARI